MSMPVMSVQKFMIENKATNTDYTKARRALYKRYIKANADTDNKRMIFTTSRSPQKNNHMTAECNGLILSMGDWSPVMVPPKNLNRIINTNKCNKYLRDGAYTVYAAYDGTCFNLYYYNNKWIISTASGYEMNMVMWDGMTYYDIISECLKDMDLTFEKLTNTLHKKYCYSFGFNHSKYHRFRQPGQKNKIWFVQCVNLDPKSDKYLNVDHNTPLENIKAQEAPEELFNDLHLYYGMAKSAFDKYVLSAKNKNMKLITPCFGFILRSDHPDLQDGFSDLLIESSLMRNIRKFWYDNTLHRLSNSGSFKKEDLVTLSAYLSNKDYEKFLTLFPQYEDVFKKYTDTFVELSKIMATVVEFEASENKDIFKFMESKGLSTYLTDLALLLLETFKTNFRNSCKLTSLSKNEQIELFANFIPIKSNFNILMNILPKQ